MIERSVYNGPFFGDESIYGTIKYIVKTSVVIEETDFSYLEETNDNRLTLITCVRNQPTKRLCVQAIQSN